jgi:peptide/nickel transport system permease protein
MQGAESMNDAWREGASFRTTAAWHRGAVSRFTEPRPVFFALLLILLVLAAALIAPLLTPYGRDDINLGAILAAPSTEHVLGTDELGRDVFTRLIYGGRFTMLVALVSVAIASFIGISLGAAAGYFGGGVDALVTGLVDLFLSVPVFCILLVAASAAGGRLWIIPLMIGCTTWMETARLVRAEILSLRKEEYIEAARSIGLRDISVITRHVLPNIMPPVVVAATVGFAHVMLIESALSFLGFGVQPPLPTWGNMLHNAQTLLRRAPLAAFAPGLMIFAASLCFNSIGEGLRSVLARNGRSM